jgi:beta-phosphoglucomutase
MKGRKVEAFVFDMDGTMMENMDYHYRAWRRVVSENGSKLEGDELFRELYGKNSEVLRRIFHDRKLDDDAIKEMAEKKEEYYRELFLPEARLLDGLEDFLKQAKNEGLRLAIGTASYHRNIDLILEKLGIAHLFDAIIGEEDVKTSKPDPETFLNAAKALNVLPSNCVVFEDVPKGVEAAANAGMKCVTILTSHKKVDFESFENIIAMAEDYTVLNVKEIIYLASRP